MKEDKIACNKLGLKSKISRFFYDLGVKFHNLPIFNRSVKKTGTFKTRQTKKRIFIIGMLSVAVVQFLIFWVYVNFNSIIMAFQIRDSGGLQWTFENFTRFFKEVKIPEFQLGSAIKNTMLLFFVGTFVTLPLSLLFAYYLFKKIFLSNVFRIIFFLPSIISAVVLVTLFKYIISSEGPFNSILTFITGKTVDIDWVTDEKYSMATILVYCLWTGFGGNIVLLTGAIHRVPESIIEYGKLDGVGMTRELCNIILPLIWPTISTLLVFATAGMFTNMGPVLLFTEGQYGTMTIGYFIFSKVTLNQYEYPAAIGLVFTVIGLPIVLIVKWLLGKISEDVEY